MYVFRSNPAAFDAITHTGSQVKSEAKSDLLIALSVAWSVPAAQIVTCLLASLSIACLWSVRRTAAWAAARSVTVSRRVSSGSPLSSRRASGCFVFGTVLLKDAAPKLTALVSEVSFASAHCLLGSKWWFGFEWGIFGRTIGGLRRHLPLSGLGSGGVGEPRLTTGRSSNLGRPLALSSKHRRIFLDSSGN